MTLAIYILGKNKSIETFPRELFSSLFTVGMNHAAMMFKTNLACTVYPCMTNEFLLNGIRAENIIGVKPTCAKPTAWGRYDEEQWPRYTAGLGHYIHYDNLLSHEELIQEDAKAAVAGLTEHVYHNLGTVLHLLLSWCVASGYSPIRLFGCNQTGDCCSGFEHEDPEFLAERRNFLDKQMAALKSLGVRIRLYEDYNDYLINKDNV